MILEIINAFVFKYCFITRSFINFDFNTNQNGIFFLNSVFFVILFILNCELLDFYFRPFKGTEINWLTKKQFLSVSLLRVQKMFNVIKFKIESF